MEADIQARIGNFKEKGKKRRLFFYNKAAKISRLINMQQFDLHADHTKISLTHIYSLGLNLLMTISLSLLQLAFFIQVTASCLVTHKAF